jgi:hypothetical protein
VNGGGGGGAELVAAGRGGCLSWQVAGGGRGGRKRARLQVQFKGLITVDCRWLAVVGWATSPRQLPKTGLYFWSI